MSHNSCCFNWSTNTFKMGTFESDEQIVAYAFIIFSSGVL